MSQQPNSPQSTKNAQQQQSSGPTVSPGTKPTPQSGNKATQNAKPVEAEQTTKKPEQHR